MFKTNKEIIVIQAKATTPVPTGVVFWSHDKGTAKMLFQLQKDYVNQTLSEGTIVPICLDFVGGRHIYHAVIEDAVNGIVSIVLEDNILGYQGRVDGSIYIELPDSRSLDTAGRFTFDIKRSPIDLNTPELEDYYWQGFNEIMDQYHQTIAEIETESERLLNELQARTLTLEEKLAGVELRARFKTAWSWSADGTDRFTKVYPRENLLLYSKLDTNRGWSGATLLDGGVMEIVKPIVTSVRITVNTTNDNEFNLDPSKFYTISMDVWVSEDAVLANDKNTSLFLRAYKKSGAFADFTALSIPSNFAKGQWVRIATTPAKPPSDTDTSKLFDLTFAISTAATGTFRFRKPKMAIVNSESDFETIYTPAPSEDPLNAYPTYKGISIVDSDNPADYSWQAEDNTIAKKATLDSHTENISNPHKVTKTQIGLGNVDNFTTATQAEAEAGAATNKFMTPSLVFKAIAKWVQDKFVSATGNETILGTKNFQDGLQAKGNNVLTHKGVVIKKYSNADFPTEIASGYITFVRYGDVIQAVFNFKTRIDNDFAKDQSIIWGIAADFQADTSEPQFIGIASTGGTTSLIKFTANGATLTAHSILTRDTWYAGTVTYLAKNKL